MDDVTLIREFEARTLPFSEWRHATHIRVAWSYVTRYPFDEALARVRRGIAAYNAANKVNETELYGYHETITEAWLRVVADHVARYGACANSEAFLIEQPHLAAKSLLRVFYSRERVVTPEAKRGFVSPDRAPLPAMVLRPPADSRLQRAASADLPALIALNPRLARDGHETARLLRALADGNVLVADGEGRVVGFVAFDYMFFDRGFINYLTVHADRRRQGLGTALTRAAAEACTTHEVFTSTNQSNEPMQALLAKLGYSRCGHADQLDSGDPEWFYVLRRAT
jgi:ribosomal protein S18 acetylase RimI-like enzyme